MKESEMDGSKDEAAGTGRRQGDLMRVSDMLFRELERLEGAEGDDLRAEIERAKVVKGLSDSVISNCNTVVKVYQAQAGLDARTRLPPQLTGGGR